MPEFRFTKIKMKVTSINVRQELHGDEHCLAMDIGLEFNQSNRALDKLDGRLVEAFYWKSPTGNTEALEGVERITDLPNLRFEHLVTPLKWAEKYEEGLFRVHHGNKPSDDIVMLEAKINEIKFHPKEGGTTLFTVRVQCNPDEAQVARMCALLQSEITGTIDSDPDDEDTAPPPGAAEQPEKPAAAKTGRKPRRGKQTDAFADAAQQIADGASAE
ncbi:hypothetical protein [Burkholderia gladioli]|uniref:hypothetical protein n=1 Tax=Burkholderia gladioli TaxID=28095 RepID=UPI00163EE8E2|nr:hypothetical protein [Burkholderia gladioli]